MAWSSNSLYQFWPNILKTEFTSACLILSACWSSCTYRMDCILFFLLLEILKSLKTTIILNHVYIYIILFRPYKIRHLVVVFKAGWQLAACQKRLSSTCNQQRGETLVSSGYQGPWNNSKDAILASKCLLEGFMVGWLVSEVASLSSWGGLSR